MTGKLSTLAAYTYEFNRIINILAQHGTEMPQEVLVTMMLSGLTAEYQPVINILNITPWATLDQVYEQLRLFQENNGIDSKFRRQPQRASGRGYSMRDNTHRRDRNNNKTNNRSRHDIKQAVKCFNCKRTHQGGERACRANCGVCGQAVT